MPKRASEAGSGMLAAAAVAETVPPKVAVKGAIVPPAVPSKGLRLLNETLNDDGGLSSNAGMMPELSDNACGGSLTFTVKPGPPTPPNTASVKAPLSTSVPVQPGPVEIQNVPE